MLLYVHAEATRNIKKIFDKFSKCKIAYFVKSAKENFILSNLGIINFVTIKIKWRENQF